MLRKSFCFLITLFFVPFVCAQPVDDIPFLFDDDDHYSTKDTVQPTIPAPIKPAPKPSQPVKPASKPIKFTPQNNQPNIGSNAKPLDTLELLPPPAPSVPIDLTSTEEQPISSKPTKPINRRTQGIDILPNSLENTTIPDYGSTTGEIGALQDVRGFDLEGFYLGMSREEALALIQENGYKIISSKEAVSKFRTSQYESQCKSRGIHAPEKIRACIAKISKLNNTTYLSTLKATRPRTRESIEFSFTSPATENRVWKIHYENKGDNSLNFTRANTRKKLDRQEAFLNALFDKFGTPDDQKKYIWGSEDDAFMQAGMYGSNYDAYITLTDTELEDEDLWQAREWLDEAKPFEHFGFED